MTEQLNIAELRRLHAGMPDTVDKFVYMAHLKMPALLDAAEDGIAERERFNILSQRCAAAEADRDGLKGAAVQTTGGAS